MISKNVLSQRLIVFELQNKDQFKIRLQLKEILDHNERCMRDKSWLTRDARAMLDPLATIV